MLGGLAFAVVGEDGLFERLQRGHHRRGPIERAGHRDRPCPPRAEWRSVRWAWTCRRWPVPARVTPPRRSPGRTRPEAPSPRHTTPTPRASTRRSDPAATAVVTSSACAPERSSGPHRRGHDRLFDGPGKGAGIAPPDDLEVTPVRQRWPGDEGRAVGLRRDVGGASGSLVGLHARDHRATPSGLRRRRAGAAQGVARRSTPGTLPRSSTSI